MKALPFQRLVQGICETVQRENARRGGEGYIDPFRWQRGALECLQTAAEDYLVVLVSCPFLHRSQAHIQFEHTQLAAIHAKRITIMRADMLLARKIRGEEQAPGREFHS